MTDLTQSHDPRSLSSTLPSLTQLSAVRAAASADGGRTVESVDGGQAKEQDRCERSNAKPKRFTNTPNI